MFLIYIYQTTLITFYFKQFAIFGFIFNTNSKSVQMLFFCIKKLII